MDILPKLLPTLFIVVVESCLDHVGSVLVFICLFVETNQTVQDSLAWGSVSKGDLAGWAVVGATGPLGAGPLWAPLGPCGLDLCGPHWALEGRALVGSTLGPCGLPSALGPSPCGPLLGPHGPGPDGPSWDIYMYTYI